MIMAELHRSASFSRCKRYRYSLRRQWMVGQGTCVFIGLNPSVADEQADDPTIRRCMGFACDWGYRQLIVVNLFAYRTPSPAELKACENPVGPGNSRAVRAACRSADLIVAAWGTHGVHRDQAMKMSQRLDTYKLHCFSRTKKGHPVHPLYQPRRARLQEFSLEGLS